MKEAGLSPVTNSLESPRASSLSFSHPPGLKNSKMMHKTIKKANLLLAKSLFPLEPYVIWLKLFEITLLISGLSLLPAYHIFRMWLKLVVVTQICWAACRKATKTGTGLAAFTRGMKLATCRTVKSPVEMGRQDEIYVTYSCRYTLCLIISGGDMKLNLLNNVDCPELLPMLVIDIMNSIHLLEQKKFQTWYFLFTLFTLQ